VDEFLKSAIDALDKRIVEMEKQELLNPNPLARRLGIPPYDPEHPERFELKE